jgi:hypothetical protein
MNRTEVKLDTELKVIKEEEIKHLLEPGEFGAILEWMVTDKDGKITAHGEKKSESFVQQFLQLLFVKFAISPAGAPISMRDTSNTLRNVFDSGYTFDVSGGATVVTYGIIIGTGAAGPTISDFAIQVIIPHATMGYSAMTFGAPAADATVSQITLTRNFANNSGGPITVREIALYCRAYYSAAIGYFMLIRDVIAGGIIVPNGQTLTVNYRPQAAC